MDEKNLSTADTEEQYVHEVYEKIADHFSLTRYKPWPVVEKFLLALSPGSCGLDVGCGNGKYLHVNPKIMILASDRSNKLASIARRTGQGDALVCDVIHHFSTAERRRSSIRAILECLHSEAPLLLFVWALEQRSSRRGWDEGSKQDVLVPWVLKKDGPESTETKTYMRYYHLYSEGELESDVVAAGGSILESGYDRDNWWTVAKKSF